MKSTRLLLLVATLMTVSADSWAKPRTKAEMAFWANKAFSENTAASKGTQPLENLTIVMEKEAVSVYATATSGNGKFAVVSNDDLLPAILGYSDTTFDPELKNPNFQWWLEAINEACQYYVNNGIAVPAYLPGTDVEPFVSPLMTSKWGQEAPYYNMCPMGTDSGGTWDGYETDGRCVTGCVATAMAQILYYHRSPQRGQGGTHSVRVKQNDGSYTTYTVDFDEAVYDWDNMLDDYSSVNYTREQADAVAQLMYHCGVAADMSYATDGSGAYDNRACIGLQRNFGFNDATFYERKSYTETEWMNMIFKELSEERPILYGGDDIMKQSGHCFVFDGYNTSGQVHVNWGWEGSYNGYYDVATLSVSGASWSSNQDMIIGIQGGNSGNNFYALDLSILEAGTLADSISARQVPLDSIAYITISGTVNNSDIATIRQIGMKGILRKLDLKDAVIPNGELPDSAFANCTNLRYVTFPECISSIGNYAFTGCNSFSELRLYNREKPTANSNIFKGVNIGSSTLLVRSGTKTRFSRSLPWKNFGQIGEFGIAVSARNCSRDYGEENPKFYYTVDGGTIKGEPEITCDATKDSPAGKYTLHVTRGTVENPEVDFVDGYMIINEDGESSVENIYTAEENNAGYDLSGRKLSSLPRGTIVITNKRKYIVK